MTDTTEHTYDYWYAALDGKNPPIDANTPEPGYYRTKKGEPVAIWYEDVVCNIMIGSDKMVALEQYEDVWTRCANRPVTEEQWQTACDNGWVWHDMDEMVRETLGDNIRDAEDAEAISALLNLLEQAAKAYETIESDEQAAKAQSLRSRALELKGRADKIREAEKKPHLEAGKKVDKVWMPLVKNADDMVVKLRKAMERFETVKLQDRRKKEAEEAAKREAERPKELDMSGPDQPEPDIQPKQGIRGGYGRAASVGTRKVVTGLANDRTPALMRYAGHAEMTALLIKLAQRDVDNGVDVTGFTIEEQAVVR